MKLTPRHNKAIELLASGATVKNVAEKLGIAPETVSRWRGDFDFQAALNALLHESQTAARERLWHLSGVALDTVEEILTDSEAPPKDRLQAAFKVIQITETSAGHVGSTNAAVLKREKEQSDLLESYGM